MDTICEGPQCDVRVTQAKAGRRRRFCSPACLKAAFIVRHSTIVWEPIEDAGSQPAPSPEPTRPDEAVAGAVIEARTLAGTFRNLGRRARPQLAWRCTKTGEAIHAALDFFEWVDR
jgi:hypothetical protein